MSIHKKKDYTPILKFYCILQLLCLVYIGFVFIMSYSSNYKSVEIYPAQYIILFSLLAKGVNIYASFRNYPTLYNKKKYTAVNVLAIILDSVSLLLSTYMFIDFFSYNFDTFPLCPIWLVILYLAVPFLLFAVSVILFNVTVCYLFFKFKKEKIETESVTDSSLSKVQKAIISVISIFFVVIILSGKCAPISVDRILNGTDFEMAVAKEYNDKMYDMISHTNYLYGNEKTGELYPYFDITSVLAADDYKTAETITYNGSTIYMQIVLHNNADGKDYVFDFSGKRKWFGSYELEMTSDFEKVMDDVV